MIGTVRRVCRNVKRWQDAGMALRWTAAAMLEAAKGFRRLKAHKQLPSLRRALAAHHERNAISHDLEHQAVAAYTRPPTATAAQIQPAPGHPPPANPPTSHQKH